MTALLLSKLCLRANSAPTLSRFCSAAGAGTRIPAPDKPAEVRGNIQQPSGGLRVRRARVSDSARVLRFLRERAHSAWPGVAPPPSGATGVVLADYVSRILAQGHTLLAEQQEPAAGPRRLSGLALGAKLCPWDAALVDRWATCIRCQRSRALLQLTAHCLREPNLHEKYRVGKILQILIIVPECPNSSEISLLLAKSAIKRGKDSGYPLMRFDAVNQTMIQVLEKTKLKKEWQICPEKIKEIDKNGTLSQTTHFSVYSAQGSA